jgi:hypothetical protein
MLMLTEAVEMTPPERYAARVADRVGPRFPRLMMVVLGLAVLGGFLFDRNLAMLIHRSAFVFLLGVMAWEHLGFSRLIEARDVEIQRLDEEIRHLRRS